MNQENITDILRQMALEQKSVILLLEGGERHHVKLIEVRDGLVVGEARCLYYNYDVGRKIHQHAMEEEKKFAISAANGAMLGLTMADAVEKFGKEAHRYKFYISLDKVYAVAEDIDDVFDETPFFSGLI